MNRVLTFFLLLAIGANCCAQTPLSVEEFVRPPAYANPTLSRSGKYFAVS